MKSLLLINSNCKLLKYTSLGLASLCATFILKVIKVNQNLHELVY